MKKATAIIAAVLIVAAAASAIFFAGNSPFSKEATEAQTTAQVEPSAYAERLSSAGYETAEDVCKNSTNLVKAALVSSERFNSAVNVSLFRVVEDYTGNTPEEIHVYDEADERFVPGKEYYLFLQKEESALYPHPIFTSTVKKLVLSADETSAETAENGKLKISPAEVAEIAKSAVQKGLVGSALGKCFEVSSSASKAKTVAEADVIAEIKVSGEGRENRYTALYQVDDYKIVRAKSNNAEKLSAPDYIFLPPGLKAGTSYYVPLKYDSDGGLAPFSRTYPVIEKSEININELI